MRCDIFVLCVLGTVVFLSPEVTAIAKFDPNSPRTKLLNTIESDYCTGLMKADQSAEEMEKTRVAGDAQCKEHYALLKALPDKEQNQCKFGTDPKCAELLHEDTFGSKARWHRCTVTLPDNKQISIFSCVRLALVEHRKVLAARAKKFKKKKKKLRKKSGSSLPPTGLPISGGKPGPGKDKLSTVISPEHPRKKKKNGKGMFNWSSEKSDRKRSRRVAFIPQTPKVPDKPKTPSPLPNFGPGGGPPFGPGGGPPFGPGGGPPFGPGGGPPFGPGGGQPFGRSPGAAFGFPGPHQFGVGGNTPAFGPGGMGGRPGGGPSSVTMGLPPEATADILRKASARLSRYRGK